MYSLIQQALSPLIDAVLSIETAMPQLTDGEARRLSGRKEVFRGAFSHLARRPPQLLGVQDRGLS